MEGWTGKIVLGEACALFVGSGGRTPLHRHLAYKIVIGLDRPIEVVDEAGSSRKRRIQPVLPGSLHAVIAEGTRVGLYYADAGAFPKSSLPRPQALRSLVSLCKRLDAGDAETVRSLKRVPTLDGSCSADSRVAVIVGEMRRPENSRLDVIASKVGLSHSRFSHLFATTVGGAPARYRRWRRLWIAAERLAQGERIVDAALDAGFSDSAHLTRTFVEMLGITPGMFQASELILLPGGIEPA
jgi:AraC-like DNA-binding protein